MSNISQSPSSQLSKAPPKVNNKQVLLKNKATKRSGKCSRNNKNNNLLSYNNTCFVDNNNNNNKPLKVVHISNPKRFQATAAEFRALVQGLTGRDAVVVDDDDDDHDHHHLCGTPRQTIVTEADDDDGSDVHHHHHHESFNNDSSSNDDDDDKVLLHHHHHHDQEHLQHQQEVNLAACFGPSSDQMLSFDYYGAFSGDLIVMEDLRAFMGDDVHY